MHPALQILLILVIVNALAMGRKGALIGAAGWLIGVTTFYAARHFQPDPLLAFLFIFLFPIAASALYVALATLAHPFLPSRSAKR